MSKRRLLGVAALAVGGVAAAWRLVGRRRRGEPGGTAEVLWPLGMGSRASMLRHRLARVLRGQKPDDLAAYEGLSEHDLDTGRLGFDWAFGSTEAEVVRTALAMEGISTHPPLPAPPDRDLLTIDKVESAGVHLDEESRDNFTPIPRSHVTGEATPRRLAQAVERALDTRHIGIIVDTSRAVVEIDEHRDVGRGNVLLIDPSGGSRLLRHGSMRTLVAALRAAADRHQVARERVPSAPPELRQLPPTVDEFLRDVEQPSTVTGPLTVRLASQLGATEHCQRCNAAILKSDAVASALAHHYGAPHRREEIVLALVRSPLETGDPRSPGFCHVHGPEARSEVS